MVQSILHRDSLYRLTMDFCETHNNIHKSQDYNINYYVMIKSVVSRRQTKQFYITSQTILIVTE